MEQGVAGTGSPTRWLRAVAALAAFLGVARLVGVVVQSAVGQGGVQLDVLAATPEGWHRASGLVAE